MALTEDDLKAWIIATVGDVDPTTGDTPADPLDGVISLGFDAMWALYESKGSISSSLRAAYVRRDAIRRVMAVLAQKRFDVADNLSGLSIRAGQIYRHYMDMLNDADSEIKAIEKSLVGGGTPSVGRITDTLVTAPGDRNQECIDAYTEAVLASED